MEFVRNDNQEVPAHSKMIEAANKLANRIAAASVEDISSSVDSLNCQAVEHGLLGENVELSAQFVIRTNHVMNSKTGKFDVSHLPDDPSNNATVVGEFQGFTVSRHARGDILMYRLQTGYDAQNRSFYMADVPVEQTQLVSQVESDPYELSRQEKDYSVVLLSAIREPRFRELLWKLTGIIEDSEEIDSVYFGEIGMIASEMLEHEAVYGNETHMQAIISLITVLIKPDSMYHLKGHSYIAPVEGETSFGIDIVDVKSKIAGVELVDGYEIDSSHKIALYEDRPQPAFTLYDQNQKKHFIPLRRLSLFAVGYEYDSNCDAFLDRSRQGAF